MKSRIEVVQGDITRMTTDVIVNAANSSLMGVAVSTALFTVRQARH